MVTDPIADLLTRIRNAEMASHSECIIPYSKIKESIVSILKKHQYILDFSVKGDGVDKAIYVSLREGYVSTQYKRISRPGQRIYRGHSDVRPVNSGLGIAIYSTSYGIMDNVQARKQKVGGELLCEVW